MNELKNFVDLVAKMRLAQTRYFELMGRAKKSKHPDDFKNARQVLEMSKQLERQVDDQVQVLSKATATEKP
jgi:hypothetical protein